MACHKCQRFLVATTLAAGLYLSAACSRQVVAPQVMSDSTFVEVMYELINARNQPGADSVALANQRNETLRKHNVTLADLEKKGEQLARNPTRATTVWGQLRRKYVPAGMGRQG